MGLFVGVLLALGVAYFLGVMTGLAGREPEEAVAAAPAEATAASRDTFPRPVLGVQPGARPRERVLLPPDAGGGRAEGASGTGGRAAPRSVQLFEDRAEGEGSGDSSPAGRPQTASAAGFWVQVISLSSEREALSRSSRLSSRGYRATVSPASGPRGTVYRVRVGPYRTREEAARAAERLSVEEKAETWIVPAR